MPYTFVNDTGGNEGVDRPLTVAEFDGNTLESKNRIEALEGQTGKQIESIEGTASGSAAQVNYTDNTTDTFPLPRIEIRSGGDWANSTAYSAGNIVTARGFGIYLVNFDHVTPAAPATFDAGALDESTDDGGLLYTLIGAQTSLAYDIPFSYLGVLPGDSQTDTAGTVIGKHSVVRAITIPEDLPDFASHLGTAAADTDGVLIHIMKNGATQIGTITFDPGDNVPTTTFPADVAFANGDYIELLLLTADGVAADFSATIAAERQDI